MRKVVSNMEKRFEQAGLRRYALAILVAAMLLACVLILRQPVHAGAPVGLPPEQSANVTPSPGCELAWRIVPSPNFGEFERELDGVEAISAQDVWAFGRGGVMHWDGQEWSIVPVPNMQGFTGMAAVTSNDIWAVGYGGGTRIWHWDGTIWSIVPHPSGGSLEGVAAISTDDVWAVGFYGADVRTRILHWNGVEWSIIPSPSPAFSNRLTSVTAVSINDVWAMGHTYTVGVGQRILAMHWDGSSWAVIPTPDTGAQTNFLYGASAASASDVWAVGYTEGGPLARTLTLHWNGTQWSIVPSPNRDEDSTHNYIVSIAAIAENDAWAVGHSEYSDPITGETSRLTLALHWNGTLWSIEPSPNAGKGLNHLRGVDAVSSNEVWSAGSYNTYDFGTTLVERYHEVCSTPTPPATSSPQPPTSTSSPTAHTATIIPTSTPSNTVAPASTAVSTSTLAPTNTNLPAFTPTTVATACTLKFSDVPSNNVFHPFIRCLACRSIVSGYNDGTFRPNHDVTRGQLSKIVANGAGFDESPSGWTFQDVAPGSTFYLFVERMAIRGVIGGYLCGGPEEPCMSPGNRPYFRPNANATRGQISKIVANAASLGDPPGEQSFEDVHPNSAFYDFIQRLASRDIMSGYPCGGTTEPCGESSRPYFRPNANATRGQTSKIVGNTFFPNCSTP